MPEPDDVRAQLEELGERRRRALDERHAVAAEMRGAIRRALDQGVRMGEIIRLSGISKQGIHKLLRDDESN